MGSVYRKDGKYLYYRVRHTHTGRHSDIDWVADINKATVFYYPLPFEDREAIVGAEKLNATETITITLEEE